MKSEMKRWKKIFLGPNMYQAKSGVIWNLWDEEMKSEMKRWTDKEIFFLVQTCIKPNLVLSEFSEMKRWRVRWRDEQMKKNFFWVRTCIKPNLVLSEISEMKRWRKFFWVRTCIKPNLVLSEISEMKRWRVRWRDEQMKKNFFWSEHVSSQIWCYLKLVRWRVRWDEQMKKIFFWVRTCIKPNLVLSEISEMKRWRVRWRDEKKFFWVQTCIKPNLVLSEISEMKRWGVSEMNRWRNFFFGLNMYQAKSGVIWN